jgi:hypothetical protein
MEVVVDLGTAGVALHQPDDLQRFAVRAVSHRTDDGAVEGQATTALDSLAAALREHDIGRVDPDGTVFIPPDAVRALAAQAASNVGGQLPAEWETNFASMLEFAASKGWIAGDGAMAAHIEWSDA